MSSSDDGVVEERCKRAGEFHSTHGEGPSSKKPRHQAKKMNWGHASSSSTLSQPATASATVPGAAGKKKRKKLKKKLRQCLAMNEQQLYESAHDQETPPVTQGETSAHVRQHEEDGEENSPAILVEETSPNEFERSTKAVNAFVRHTVLPSNIPSSTRLNGIQQD